MTDIAQLGIKIEASDIKSAVRELDRLDKKAGQVEKSTLRMERGFGGLQSAIAALGFTVLTRQVIKQINTYSALNNKLKLVTNGTDDLKKAHASLFNIAQETRGSLEGTIDLYSRLARSTEDLGISSDRLAAVTKTVNQTIALSGAEASTAQASLFQLGQGLGAGALRGEELNSVLEGTPELARAIANGLGVTIGQLREMGAQGELTADKVIGALENQANAVDREFSQTAKTVEQALQQIENVALRTFGAIDSRELIEALDTLKDTLQDPAVVSGLQSIGAGLLNMVTIATKGVSSFGEFGKALGYMAARIAGADMNIGQMQERLEGLQANLKQLQGTRAGFMGSFLISEDEINAKKAEIDALIAKIQALKNLQENVVTTKPEVGAPAAPADQMPVMPEDTPEYRNAILLNEALKELDRQRTEDAKIEAENRAANELAASQMMLSSASAIYSNLSELIAATGNDSKNIQLAMLVFEKGLAIAQSIINTQVGVTKALSIDPTGVLAARVEALGNIATGLIAATGIVQAGNISGGRAGGGPVMAGQSYMVGENGPEKFTPSVGGQITNSNDISGGVKNIYNIQVLDAEGVDRVLEKHGDKFYNNTNRFMYENGQKFA